MDATFVWKLAKLGRLGSSRIRYDDDFIDRLNYQMTGVILFLFIGIISIRQYVGKPIQCWSPQEFTRGWEEYTENYCWVANTYYAPLERRLPNSMHRSESTISYYQWAWIFMGVQALLFYLPCLIWRGLYPQSRFNVRRIMQMAGAATEIMLPLSNKSDQSGSGSTVRFIAKYIDSCIRRRHAGLNRIKKLNNNHNGAKNNNTSNTANPSTLLKPSAIAMTSSATNDLLISSNNYTASRCMCCGHRPGNCLALIYMFIKILYFSNSLFQLYIMKVFIGTKNFLYGLYFLSDLIQSRHWTESGNFPRVTFCDFEAKKLGKNHLYTLQCVLPINMILEKVFIILWFWISMLTLTNFVSLMVWMWRIFYSRMRVTFVRRQLHIMSSLPPQDRALSRGFSEQYLGADGIFLLRLVGANCCEFVAGQLTLELWHLYKHRLNLELEELKFGGVPPYNTSSLSPTQHHHSQSQQHQHSSHHHHNPQTHKSSSSKVNYTNSNRCVAPLPPSGINNDDIV